MSRDQGGLGCWLWLLLFVVTAVRLVLAACMPLTPDEAYYWVWSRHIEGGYLDHPFMVALWIRVGTFIAGENPFGVRLLGPISAFFGSCILYKAATNLITPGLYILVGERAVLLLNATLMLGLGAATMTPDTPLLFFVSLTLYALSRALIASEVGLSRVWWAITGAMLGLAFDAKYTAALIGIGIGGFVLTDRRRLWRQLGPWGAIPVLMMVMSPVIYWNATHHWASFIKQGGRNGDWHPARALQFLGELLGGQIGLATPIIFVIFVYGAYRTLRRENLLAWLIFLPACVFFIHAFGDRVQANWPAVIYPVLALAAAGTNWRIRTAVVSGFALTLGVTVQAAFSPVPLTAHQDPILRQTAGWQEFAHSLAVRATEQGASALVVRDYALASELAFSQNVLPVVGDDPRWQLFSLPAHNVAIGLRVEEERRDKNSADICRLSKGHIVRCYASALVSSVQGAQLPKRF
ncbi:ArnT family glycosyltransferase [Gluconobacter wancherniae]|uniref:ArnT family glycosyltransferase n=1 Tax=Gluconobacter wancherniae TaxID=1307955 RepID=UPI001B8ACA70|nr:glycosyltransferase family 39 protein [Gluconobacter wancherniae]MBS1088936.1 glycosyltransferase family 39 protein [Gluconobacter wancherniae]